MLNFLKRFPYVFSNTNIIFIISGIFNVSFKIYILSAVEDFLSQFKSSRALRVEMTLTHSHLYFKTISFSFLESNVFFLREI